MLSLLIIITFTLINNVYLSDVNNPIVTTPLGKIKGTILTSVLGRSIYSFRGIRYAKPPVNKLRFKPPIPVEKWNHTYDAAHDGAQCPQPSSLPVSEDCLFLNVYTTKLPQGENYPKQAVIVYFHAGGFYSVSGSSYWEGPQYFLDQDIVLVTLNYRLGSLGFLSTGDELAPGNNGLKDQVVALRWVRDNIAAFEGNPNLVTISGYSAGGASVTLHLISPMSRGLFHRAIGMSGSIYGNWPVQTNQFDLAQKQARLLGCPDDTSANIIKCLKTKSTEDIGNSLSAFAEFGFDPILIWLPLIESDFGQERFLTDDPVKLVLQGKFEKVPVMAGVTTLEFAGSAYNIVHNATLLKEMDEDFALVAPIAFIYERNTEKSKHISKELRKFYLGDGFGVNRGVKLLAEKNDKPVYYYRFSYRGRYSHFYIPGTQTPLGVVHHDDLIYLFYISVFPKFNVTTPEYEMVRKLTKLHANFANTGNPTPIANNANLDYPLWNKFSNKNKEYLDIGKKLVMKKNLYEDRYEEWEELFPLPTL